MWGVHWVWAADGDLGHAPLSITVCYCLLLSVTVCYCLLLTSVTPLCREATALGFASSATCGTHIVQ